MKKSILLYTELGEVVDSLSDKQAGVLFKAIFKYESTGAEPDFEKNLKPIFIPIRQSLDRAKENYNAVCKRNSDNIGKRWNKEDTKNTSGISGIPENTKNTNSDSNSDNDNKENKEEKKNTKEKSPSRFSAPSLNQVIDFFSEKGYTVEHATKAFEHYEIANWHDSYGKKVKNWKQKLQTNWMKEDGKVLLSGETEWEKNKRLALEQMKTKKSEY